LKPILKEMDLHRLQNGFVGLHGLVGGMDHKAKQYQKVENSLYGERQYAL